MALDFYGMSKTKIAVISMVFLTWIMTSIVPSMIFAFRGLKESALFAGFLPFMAVFATIGGASKSGPTPSNEGFLLVLILISFIVYIVFSVYIWIAIAKNTPLFQLDQDKNNKSDNQDNIR